MRRASVQGCPSNCYVSGTVEWWEHVEAWEAYAERYGMIQSDERINERGGFSYGELVDQLGHKPTTWRPHS